MQRKSLAPMGCPIAQALDRVGEWWSILILRDAFTGITRFDDFQQSLGISPGMLTRRLTALVKAGLLARHRYSDAPPRDEYRLTPRGEDFRTVLIALLAWGNRHFPPPGGGLAIVDAETLQAAEPMLVDRRTGKPLAHPAYVLARGKRTRPSRLLGA